MNDGLRSRLFQWLLVPWFLLFVGGMVSDYYLAIEPVNTAFDEALSNTAVAIGAQIQRENGKLALRLTPKLEAALRADRTDFVYFAVFNEDGGRIGGDADLPFVGRCEETCFRDISFAIGLLRIVVVPYSIDDEVLFIEVAETTDKRDQMSRRAVAASAGSNLAMILVTLMLIGWGIEGGLKPLERLRGQIATRSLRDLTPLETVDVPEEILPLIEALNRQFSLLTESLSSQDRFLADAAHQLKTPLSALKSQIEQTEARAAQEIATLDVAAIDAERAWVDADALYRKAKVDAAIPKQHLSALDYDRYQGEQVRTERDLAVRLKERDAAIAAVKRRRDDARLEIDKLRQDLLYNEAQVAMAEVKADVDGVVVHENGFGEAHGRVLVLEPVASAREGRDEILEMRRALIHGDDDRDQVLHAVSRGTLARTRSRDGRGRGAHRAFSPAARSSRCATTSRTPRRRIWRSSPS